MAHDNSLIGLDSRKIKLQDLYVLGHQVDVVSDDSCANIDSNAGEDAWLMFLSILSVILGFLPKLLLCY